MRLKIIVDIKFLMLLRMMKQRQDILIKTVKEVKGKETKICINQSFVLYSL